MSKVLKSAFQMGVGATAAVPSIQPGLPVPQTMEYAGHWWDSKAFAVKKITNMMRTR